MTRKHLSTLECIFSCFNLSVSFVRCIGRTVFLEKTEHFTKLISMNAESKAVFLPERLEKQILMLQGWKETVSYFINK